jgi:hypothetical protein
MKLVLSLLVVTLALLSPVAAEAEEDSKETIGCKMRFSLKGWSVFYKTGKGSGTVTCDNGESAEVLIRVKGGGLTFGKSEVLDGKGVFSPVYSIDEVFGSYASAGAQAAAGVSAAATAMTKGEVSLSLRGTGRGIELGFDFGRFKIKRKK